MDDAARTEGVSRSEVLRRLIESCRGGLVGNLESDLAALDDAWALAVPERSAGASTATMVTTAAASAAWQRAPPQSLMWGPRVTLLHQSMLRLAPGKGGRSLQRPDARAHRCPDVRRAGSSVHAW